MPRVMSHGLTLPSHCSASRFDAEPALMDGSSRHHPGLLTLHSEIRLHNDDAGHLLCLNLVFVSPLSSLRVLTAEKKSQ